MCNCSYKGFMYHTKEFKKTIPVLKVTKVKREQAPNDPYVYRNNQ
ncbi:TIGR03943 family putative permease subunit [Priestia megaterium]